MFNPNPDPFGQKEYASRTYGKHAPRWVPNISPTLTSIYRQWDSPAFSEAEPGRHRATA